MNDRITNESQDALLRYGQYAHLLHDPYPTSLDIITLIDDLRMTRQPTITSRLGAIVAPLGLAIVAGLVFRGIPFLASLGNLLLFVGVPLCVLGYLLYLRGTQYTIDRGRIEVTSGILSKRTKNIELWRVSNIELERSVINQLTGDGTLILNVFYADHPERVKIVGLTKMPELEELRVKLLNLIGLLRSHPSTKGAAA
jgi:membrane protein YdbS with pleckstrin-like domain